MIGAQEKGEGGAPSSKAMEKDCRDTTVWVLYFVLYYLCVPIHCYQKPVKQSDLQLKKTGTAK